MGNCESIPRKDSLLADVVIFTPSDENVLKHCNWLVGQEYNTHVTVKDQIYE